MSNSTSTTPDLATSTEAPPPATSTPSPANSEPPTVSTSIGPPTTSTSTPITIPPTSSSTTALHSSTPPSSVSTTPTLPTTVALPSASPSVITVTSGGSLQPITTIVTLTSNPNPATSQTSTSSSSTFTPGLADTGNSTSSGGLSGGGKTAVEVIVPIVGVALLVLAGLLFWRRRKQRKDAEEIRRKEVEEYGYNPNEDPTLPPIGGIKSNTGDGPFEMREDEGGYRGWGTTAVGSSGKKASTTMSGGPVGMAYSEGTSPSHAPVSDARSGDTLIGSPSGRPDSEEVLGAMGPSAAGNRGGDMHRGPSNASSSYSAANRSDASGDGPLPGGAYGAAQYYSGDANYGGPYADAAPGRAEMSGTPVIRDNLARRATRIENPSHFPTQASAGISQNF